MRTPIILVLTLAATLHTAAFVVAPLVPTPGRIYVENDLMLVGSECIGHIAIQVGNLPDQEPYSIEWSATPSCSVEVTHLRSDEPLLTVGEIWVAASLKNFRSGHPCQTCFTQVILPTENAYGPCPTGSAPYLPSGTNEAPYLLTSLTPLTSACQMGWRALWTASGYETLELRAGITGSGNPFCLAAGGGGSGWCNAYPGEEIPIYLDPTSLGEVGSGTLRDFPMPTRW